jgi:hypothetical protein
MLLQSMKKTKQQAGINHATASSLQVRLRASNRIESGEVKAKIPRHRRGISASP